MAWIMEGDQVTNTEFPSMLGTPFIGDGPLYLWRITQNINNGLPFKVFMPSLLPYFFSDYVRIGNTPVISMYLGDEPVIALK